MKILITGGAGFIGSNLVHHLLTPGRTEPVELVVNLDLLTYAGNLANLQGLEKDPRHIFIEGSINDTALVKRLLQQHQIEAVMHLAAETHVDRSIDTPEPFVQTNAIGTLRLLEASRQHYAALKGGERTRFRFLHVSTDEVFGALGPTDAAFCETTPYNPRSPYSASKAASDHLVRAYGETYGLPVLLTNCSNNYGPRQFPEKLIPLMILNLLDDRNLPVYGDGQQRRDWLYVEDNSRALEIVLRRGLRGETYAIGGEAERANLEIVQILCDLLDEISPRHQGGSHRTKIVHVADRPGHDRRYAMNISKIKSALGWRPAEDLISGLRKTVEWYLNSQQSTRDTSERTYARARRGLG